MPHPLKLTLDTKCTVCRLAKAVFYSPAFLGTKDCLCMSCFYLWYDRGMTGRQRILDRRMELQGRIKRRNLSGKFYSSIEAKLTGVEHAREKPLTL